MLYNMFFLPHDQKKGASAPLFFKDWSDFQSHGLLNRGFVSSRRSPMQSPANSMSWIHYRLHPSASTPNSSYLPRCWMSALNLNFGQTRLNRADSCQGWMSENSVPWAKSKGRYFQTKHEVPGRSNIVGDLVMCAWTAFYRSAPVINNFWRNLSVIAYFSDLRLSQKRKPRLKGRGKSRFSN